ncbi:MAG: DapH/DapD/GlmU-related protein [Candidatus Methylomirabilia bacterium]
MERERRAAVDPDLPEKVLGEQPLVHPGAEVRNCRLGTWTEIGPGWSLLEQDFGDYSYAAGTDGVIHNALVGKFCSFASHVVVNPGDHPMERVTQHHLTYRRRQFGLAPEDESEFFAWRRSLPCEIGHDVWIGHGAKVMAGVTIGTGAVIGAGAVVTRDIGPYEIAVGAPARTIRTRFTEDVCRRLLASAWWDWDRPTLEERWRDLSDLPRFLERYCRTSAVTCRPAKGELLNKEERGG